jgi:hypothetical protein
MATRYYPTFRTPNTKFYGSTKGTWARQSLQSRSWSPRQFDYLLSTVKTGGGTVTQYASVSNQQGNHDFQLFRFVTPPLQAQTVSGTLDICFQVCSRWIDAVLSPSNDSVVRFKVHAYITNGQTPDVRHVLLDNYVDSSDWPFSATAQKTWKSLASPQALTSGSVTEGDSIIIELGARIVSSPTPAPTYPPSNYTNFPIRGIGVNASDGTPRSDGTPGSTSDILVPWFEFSGTISELDLSGTPAPDNDSDSEAIDITTLPYNSGAITAYTSVDTLNKVWWKHTATATGLLYVSATGSNYRCKLRIYTGTPGSLTEILSSSSASTSVSQQFTTAGAIVFCKFSATTGTTYYFSIETTSYSVGTAKLSLISLDPVPQQNDLFLPNGYHLNVFRNGILVNARNLQNLVTGVAIDYTERTMPTVSGGTHSAPRVLVGLFNYPIVEILDAETFDEVNYIYEAFYDVAGDEIHVAQLAVTSLGMLYAGCFGDGFLYVAGVSGTRPPAIYNAPSSNSNISAIKKIDATYGDEPDPEAHDAVLISPAIEIAAPWVVAIDETNGILYYTTGGLYEPIGGQQIKRWSLTTNNQMSDFATISLQSGNNPGIKGMCVLPDGGLLVCNSIVIHRLNSSGTITQTYTPSDAIEAQSLCDVKIEADGLHFWVVDEESAHLFRFELASGVETDSITTDLMPGTLVQMALYSEGEPVEPPTPGTLTVIKSAPEVPSQEFTIAVGGGLSPSSLVLKDTESQLYTNVLPGSGYSVIETVPLGWSVAYTVSNGSPNTNITVASGESVVVTVINTISEDATVVANGGIYKIVPGKREDTLWLTFLPSATIDVKIPDPYIRTGLVGE